MTVREMMIYVDVAIDRIEDLGHELTKDEIINELHYLAYHCNKKDVMLEKDYREEKFFWKIEGNFPSKYIKPNWNFRTFLKLEFSYIFLLTFTVGNT